LATRIVRATIYSILYLLTYVLISTAASSQPRQAEILDPMFGTTLNILVGVVIISLFASELLARTIYQHVFNAARAIILTALFINILNGGILSLDLPLESTTMHVTADIRAYLLLLIFPNLLAFARNILQAIDLMEKKTTET
jgi:hypothetical protein